MNELQKVIGIENKRLDNARKEIAELINDFNCFDFLYMAKEHHEKGDFKVSELLFQLGWETCPEDRTHVFSSLYSSVRMDLAWGDSLESSEDSLHGHIKRNVNLYFGENTKILEHEYSIGKKRADFLIKKDSELHIVECKKGDIDKSALKQIQHYLKQSGVKKGILIGKNCNVKLPREIEFISFFGKWQRA